MVQNEKRQGDNQPYGLVYYAQLEALFPPGHPYRHSTIGSMADLDAASLENLRQWHRDNYGPNNAVLVLAGDIDAASARTLVQRYFGHIPRGAQNNRPRPTSRPCPPASTSRCMTACPTPACIAPGSCPACWTKPRPIWTSPPRVLGGLASSRLDNALVRGDETATAVTTGCQAFHRLGMFTTTVDVKPGGDVEAVSAKLDQLIADFIASGPTADEVARVVTSRMSQQIQALEPVGGFGGKAVVLAEGELYAGDPDFYKQRTGRPRRRHPRLGQGRHGPLADPAGARGPRRSGRARSLCRGRGRPSRAPAAAGTPGLRPARSDARRRRR